MKNKINISVRLAESVSSDSKNINNIIDILHCKKGEAKSLSVVLFTNTIFDNQSTCPVFEYRVILKGILLPEHPKGIVSTLVSSDFVPAGPLPSDINEKEIGKLPTGNVGSLNSTLIYNFKTSFPYEGVYGIYVYSREATDASSSDWNEDDLNSLMLFKVEYNGI